MKIYFTAIISSLLLGCSSYEQPNPPANIALHLNTGERNELILVLQQPIIGTHMNYQIYKPEGIKSTSVNPNYFLQYTFAKSSIVGDPKPQTIFSIKGAGTFQDFLVNVRTPKCSSNQYLNLEEGHNEICGIDINVKHF
ncbi:hypothetical protein [Vibrio lentus]|uniref:hypothetical protein n=1 Tax=Vibrio lentus TaxID=136468 RepID=UPI001E5B16E2|nr:hypothetical protein [Vibrio lentus]MCC4838119.1 hypothetical protein [Vibrio lentus]